MQIVGIVTMSHSPSWDLQPDDGAPRAYVDAVFAARDMVAAARPDVIVAFGPDHARNFFFDVMPSFCIGVDRVNGFGDFGSPKGPLPSDPALAQFVAEAVAADGFDPALSWNMGIDHGISQPLIALTPELDVPVVPVMISTGGPPLPTFARCHALGQAIGKALRTYEGKAYGGGGRVLIVGSGGLSHWPPSVSPADAALPDDTRDYVINGRTRAAEFNAAREKSSLARRAKGGTGPINEAWDRWLLDRLRAGDMDTVLAIDNATLLEKAGPGGQEIRAWIAALGAWGGDLQTTAYAPVPTWITGMGCATAFVEKAA